MLCSLMRLLLVVLVLVTLRVSRTVHTKPSFDSAQLVFDGDKLNTPLEFNITFRPTRIVGVNEVIVVRLPRFTMGLSENGTARNISYGDVLISPSYFFVAKFVSGYNTHDNYMLPYQNAELHIMPLYNVTFAKQAQYTITVFKENGIGAVCGFPSSETVNITGQFTYPTKPFTILTAKALEAPTYMPTEQPTRPTAAPSASPTADVPTAKPTATPTNPTAKPTAAPTNPTVAPTFAPTVQQLFYHNDSYTFDFYPGLGPGCKALQLCTKQGQCDYCLEKCHCFDGYGSDSDLIGVGRDVQPDCSSRVCPSGKAFADVPSSSDKAHAVAECSNRGTCNRQTGQCRCYPPFTGSACEKMSCPNDCSGHGQCLSMGELSRVRALENSRRIKFQYGSSEGFDTVAWDHDVIHGCLCDSSWAVGYGDGQTQLAEYFGADCSLRRCPSGDDPFTTVDETNCQGLSQAPGDPERGYFGNKCYVECSRRGTCDYKTGTCKCFQGSWGAACENIANAGRRTWEAGADTETFWLSGSNSSIIVEGN